MAMKYRNTGSVGTKSDPSMHLGHPLNYYWKQGQLNLCQVCEHLSVSSGSDLNHYLKIIIRVMNICRLSVEEIWNNQALDL